jgi:NADPH2 dehydrogenase
LSSCGDVIYSPNKDKAIFKKDAYSKELTKEDILRIENDFVESVKRAKKAGYDGIQLHGAGLYLIADFLSTKYNRRNDEYGGSDEKRAKFLEEIIKKIRAEIGDDMIL